MVAQNPLFAGWSLKKFKATVINDIWPEVLFFTAIGASECQLLDLSCPISATSPELVRHL
ncbi:hypothetical protein C8Q80DRAFT_1175534 [Daedaleopsis nitida]|nr:hypothetical protein C8Q80DRAFT_1175534 [Daedaleopsis nitida]